MFQLGKILVLSVVATMGTSAIAANAVSNTLASWNILAGGAINNLRWFRFPPCAWVRASTNRQDIIRKTDEDSHQASPL